MTEAMRRGRTVPVSEFLGAGPRPDSPPQELLLHAVLPWLSGFCEAHGFLDRRGRTKISRALNLLSGREPRTGPERAFLAALWQEVERRRITLPMPGAPEIPGALMTRSAATAEPDMLTRRATAAAPLTLNADRRTVEATIASETPIPRSGPNPAGERERWVEVIPASAVDLTSFPVPLLKDHLQSVDSVIGSVTAPRISEGQLVATLTYARNEGGEAALALVRDGHALAVSVGYRVRDWRRIDADTFEASDVEILEVSSVAIGADRNARVRSGDSRGAEPHKAKGKTMNTHVAPPDGAEIPARVRALAEGGGIATPEMIDTRATVLRALGDLAARHQLTDGELRRSVNAALAAPDDAAADRAMRGAVLDVLAERDAAVLGGTREPALGVRVGASWDSPAAQRAKLSDARAAQVCDALGLRHEPTSGRELAGLDAVAQARWLADQRGERGLRSDRQALDWFARTGAGSHGTSDFPAVASGTVEVVVARQIEQAPIALLQCVTRIPASDWRARRHVDFSSASRLRDQMEAAELQYGTIDETGEPLAPPKRKALGVKLTHEAIRNAVSHGVQLEIRLARAMVEAANEAARSTIGAQIINPDNLEDGVSPFDASRGTDGGEAVLGVPALSLAQAALSRLRDTQGTPRPVPLDILLVAPEQHTDAEKLVAELSPAQVDQANPFARRIRVLSDPELPAGSWYALPSPAAYDGLALITLDDMPTPRIESREAWNTFATEWRLQWPMAASWLKPVWWKATYPSG